MTTLTFRGVTPRISVVHTAPTALGLVGLFIFSLLFFTTPVSAESSVTLLDSVAPGSLSEWSVTNTGGNPIFTYEEIVSPYDNSTAIRTSVVGSTIMECPTQYIEKTYAIAGNTSTTKLQAYLAFTSTLDTYNFPTFIVILYNDNDEAVGVQTYYGPGIVGSYHVPIIAQNPESYTELPVVAGDVEIDLSPMGTDIDFTHFAIRLGNYACVGENSVTFDHLRVVNGIVPIGTADNPAPITTCQEFQDVTQNPSWYYDLKNDLNCAETKTWNGGAGFKPISDFTGVFEGNNHNISNLYMNAPDSGGIFAGNSGTIRSLNFRDADVSSVGYGGGLTRHNFGTIHQSSFTGTVTCGYQQCGALAGTNSGTIRESWVDAIVTGPNYVGALAGHSYGGVIRDSYVKGAVHSSSQSGGAVGLLESILQRTYAATEITESANNGGLIGWLYNNGAQSDAYWDTEVSSTSLMCGKTDTTCEDNHGLTTEAMKVSTNFSNWNFEDIWAINPTKNEGYPYLRWQTSFTNSPEPEPEVEEPAPEEDDSDNSGTRYGSRRPHKEMQVGRVLGAQTSVLTEEQLRLILVQLVEILKMYRELLEQSVPTQ